MNPKMKKSTLLCLFFMFNSIQSFSTNNKDTVYNNFDNDLYEKVKSCLSIQYDSVYLFKMKNYIPDENIFAHVFDNYIYLFNLMHLNRIDFCKSQISQFYKLEMVKSILLKKKFYSDSYSIDNTIYIYGDDALDSRYEFGLLLFKNSYCFTFIAFSPNNSQFAIVATNPAYFLRIMGITLFESDMEQIQKLIK